MKRYYVTTQFAVEATDPLAAELFVARRIQDVLGISDVICEKCGATTHREGGHPKALIVAEASTGTDEAFLESGPPLLTQQVGFVPEGGDRG
jgi:hypothetical protein